MYRRYYSYNDMPSIAGSSAGISAKSDSSPPPSEAPPSPLKEHDKKPIESHGGKFLGHFENDDIILLVIVLLLLLDDCDDKLLLAALGFIFLTGI